jgi:hypothetical protein
VSLEGKRAPMGHAESSTKDSSTDNSVDLILVEEQHF